MLIAKKIIADGYMSRDAYLLADTKLALCHAATLSLCVYILYPCCIL